MEQQSKNSISLVFGYLFIGLLIGYISGLTSSDVAKTILTTLFAFIGGKVLNDIGKKTHQQLGQIGYILIAFSIAFLIGLNGGIVVKVNQLLSWHTHAGAKKTDSAHADVYLRANDSVKRDVETKYRKGEISKDSVVKLYFREIDEHN